MKKDLSNVSLVIATYEEEESIEFVLNELSNLMPLKLKREVKIRSDSTKINKVRKYLFISLKSKLILVNNSLFIKIFLGLLKDKI